MRNHYPAIVSLSFAILACGEVKSANEPKDAPTGGTSTFTLTVMRNGNGTGTVTSGPAGINCGNDCSEAYASSTSVTLTATPDAGTTFVGWTGGGCSGTAACTVASSADVTVTASFALTNTLVVTLAGNGFVMSNPAGISCGTDCSEVYAPNTTVVLTASAAIGWVFSGWSGGGCTGTGTCSVTIAAAVMVTATFTLSTYALTVSTLGNGSGAVTSNPAGISCGSDCTENYNFNTPVVLTATPGVGSTFSGWSGGGCSGAGTCSVTITTATTVTATFTLNTYTLTVTKSSPNGAETSLTVTSNPAGINCGSSCVQSYNYGTTVTLTATTVEQFNGWSGGGCSGTGTCTVTITAATSVNASVTATARPPSSDP